MDVWIAADVENLRRLIDALVKFGFDRGSLSVQMFTGVESLFRMGIPPNRLEVITRIDGVEFKDCYTRRQIMHYDGTPVAVIAFEDLKRNKLSTGRPGDAEDIRR